MSKGPVLEIQFPADFDWHGWFQRRDKIQDHYILLSKGRMRAMAV
ncbi:MAG: hypothetical protein ACYS67_01725 [Planctomycetota bacterium]